MTQKISIGVLVSGGGSNLQAIIDACESNQIDAKVAFVGSDNPEAYGLKRAEQHNIPTFCVDYRAVSQEILEKGLDTLVPEDFDLKSVMAKQRLFTSSEDTSKAERYLRSRAVFEAALLSNMAEHPFDLIALAGFMRVVTPYFIDRVNKEPSKPRLMNIHPALLPSFPGVDGYGDTYRYGCKVAGCTIHFVDYGEDTGPIIGQKAFEIGPNDTLDEVRAKGLKLEWDLYKACIQLFAEDRLKVILKTYKLGRGKEVKRKVVEIAAPSNQP